MPIYLKNHDIVVPGEVIAEGNYEILSGAYRLGRKIVADVIGVLYIREGKIKVVPVEGSYYPSVGDRVIGKIVDYSIVSWYVDIRAPYLARLDANDYFRKPIDPSKFNIKDALDVGDIIFAEISVAERASNVQLVANKRGLGKLSGGTLIEVNPKKIPRILGKSRAMLNTIINLTKSKIIVGNNGYIWISAPDRKIETVVIEAIRKIERESHVPGLTDRIKNFILSEIGNGDVDDGGRKSHSPR